MNIRLVAAAVLAMILILLVVGWGLVLQDWKRRGYTGSDLRQRQRRVRAFAAVVVLMILSFAIGYWRLLASGATGTGPGTYLIPLGAIVCLVGVISVRGLWFLTRLRWFNSVSNRVSLQAGFVAFVSAWTAFDLKDVPDPAFAYLLVFAFLAAMVALGSFFLELLLPDSEDMLGLIVDLQESQTMIDEKTNKAVEALKDAARLVVELERSIKGRSEKVNALRQESEKYSEMVKVDAGAANALLEEVLVNIDLRANRERWVNLGVNVAIGLGTGSLFFVIGLFWNTYIKGWLGI